MKSTTVFLTIENTTQSLYPAITFHLNIDTVTVNASHFTHRPAAGLLGDHPDQFNAILSREINKPLGNLGLAVEMLEVAACNDADLIMDVISRSAMRINNLLGEFKHYQHSK